MKHGKKIGAVSATALVVANMLGTGVFTSLGLQLKLVQNGWSILLLWLLGGIMALAGAFSYAELSTRYPKLGGEYRYLSELIHPFAGYLAGWVSLTVAFPAAIALSAMAMSSYLSPYTGLSEKSMAICIILLISAIHSINLYHSQRFQNISTAFKLLVLIGLVLLSISLPGAGTADWSSSWYREMLHPAFGVAFLFSVYAYSGWNAAAYIAEEIDTPRYNLPKALIAGTLLVTALYIAMQWALLRQIPVQLLQGQIDVGRLAGEFMFGELGGRAFSTAIALFLVSGISAMIWVGPRVTRAMAEDYPLWGFLKKDNSHGIPVRAIWLQALIALALLYFGSFEQLLLYTGFTLQFFTALTVFSLFRARKKEIPSRNIYLSPGYPFIQVFFLLLSAWVMAFRLYLHPFESLAGLLLLAAGTAFWLLGSKIKAK